MGGASSTPRRFGSPGAVLAKGFQCLSSELPVDSCPLPLHLTSTEFSSLVKQTSGSREHASRGVDPGNRGAEERIRCSRGGRERDQGSYEHSAACFNGQRWSKMVKKQIGGLGWPGFC